MIFLSHNFKDKPIVEQIAIKLRDIFGSENIFYDSWSIQPGDSLIGKMDEGLTKAQYFFLFLSKNSMTSKMVTLEWKSALLKATNDLCKIVPIRLDNSPIPTILSDFIYLDLYTNGLETTLRQIVDVVSGQSTFRENAMMKNNLMPVVRYIGNEIQVLIKPNYYMEPTAIFMFMTENDKDEIKWVLTSDNMCESGFNNDVKLNSGEKLNGIYIGITRALTPEYPLTITFQARTDKQIRIKYILKGDNPKQFKSLSFLEEHISK